MSVARSLGLDHTYLLPLGLALTARSEAEVVSYQGAPANSSTASALAQLVPPLVAAVDNEDSYPQDVLQATVCLGWIHWVLDEPGLAHTRLPRAFDNVIASLSRG